MKKLILLTVTVTMWEYIHSLPTRFQQLFNKFKIQLNCFAAIFSWRFSSFLIILSGLKRGHVLFSDGVYSGDYLRGSAYT